MPVWYVTAVDFVWSSLNFKIGYHHRCHRYSIRHLFIRHRPLLRHHARKKMPLAQKSRKKSMNYVGDIQKK
jgi:hypothetical protein